MTTLTTLQSVVTLIVQLWSVVIFNPFMLRVIMLNAIMLNVVMLNVVMLCVVAPGATIKIQLNNCLSSAYT